MVNGVIKAPSASALLPGAVIEPFEPKELAMETMRSVNADRLKRTLQVTSAAARERGFTQEKLIELLRRDS